jgi:sulfur-carrier protein adenylyltransferase/sulfurtransferase
MLDKEELKRYQSHLVLNNFGVQNQIKLKKAKVLCVGAGGIASPLLYYLVAAGIGHLGIIDNDRVSLNNLTRQILYATQDDGIDKVVAAKKKLKQLNPNVNIETYRQALTLQNASTLLAGHDLIADCSDNFKTKLLINDICFQLRKVFVTASVSHFEGHFSFFNGQMGPCYRCLFGGVEDIGEQSCTDLGVFSPMLGILGSLQAMAIIQYLIGFKCDFQHLITIDALTLDQKKYKITLNPECSNHQNSAEEVVEKMIPKIEINSLDELAGEEYLLIDVRSQQEHLNANIGGDCIPLDELSVWQVPATATKIVLYCQSGRRSYIGCELLRSRGHQEVYSLAGGMQRHIL